MGFPENVQGSNLKAYPMLNEHRAKLLLQQGGVVSHDAVDLLQFLENHFKEVFSETVTLKNPNYHTRS